MASRKINICTTQTLLLSYHANDYPGWGLSAVVPNPLIAPDGCTYHFKGLTTVVRVIDNPGIVIVKIYHNAKMDASMVPTIDE